VNRFDPDYKEPAPTVTDFLNLAKHNPIAYAALDLYRKREITFEQALISTIIEMDRLNKGLSDQIEKMVRDTPPGIVILKESGGHET
jgi:hypothetical protein